MSSSIETNVNLGQVLGANPLVTAAAVDASNSTGGHDSSAAAVGSDASGMSASHQGSPPAAGVPPSRPVETKSPAGATDATNPPRDPKPPAATSQPNRERIGPDARIFGAGIPSSTVNVAANQQNDAKTTRIKKLFGSNPEYVSPTDNRIPQILKNEMASLGIDAVSGILAVQCGPATNLVVLVLPYADDQQNLTELLTLNPILCQTYLVFLNKMAVVWIKVEGARPGNCAWPGALWISRGMVPAVIDQIKADDTGRFQTMGDNIVTINFADLKWSPEAREAFLLNQIEADHGKLVQSIGPRRRVVNYRTAATFMVQLLSLIYDADADSFFYHPNNNEKLKPVSKHELDTTVSIWLQRQVVPLSPSSVGVDHVKNIIKFIKTICTIERPDEVEGLKLYLRECLERRSGSSLTTKEIFGNYVEYCSGKALATFPECVFLDKLTKLVRQQFGLTKSHNILRPHAEPGRKTARYGFNKLGFKSSDKVEVKDAKEVVEHPEVGK